MWRDRWWIGLPMVQRGGEQRTDVCGQCGHCRDRHHYEWPKGHLCLVRKCVCGPGSTQFHVAGLPKNMILDTITEDGQVRSLPQPAPPGKSLL